MHRCYFPKPRTRYRYIYPVLQCTCTVHTFARQPLEQRRVHGGMIIILYYFFQHGFSLPWLVIHIYPYFCTYVGTLYPVIIIVIAVVVAEGGSDRVLIFRVCPYSILRTVGGEGKIDGRWEISQAPIDRPTGRSTCSEEDLHIHGYYFLEPERWTLGTLKFSMFVTTRQYSVLYTTLLPLERNCETHYVELPSCGSVQQGFFVRGLEFFSIHSIRHLASRQPRPGCTP